MNRLIHIILLVLIISSSCGTDERLPEMEQWLEVRNSDNLVDFVNFAFQYPDFKKTDSCYYHIDNLVRNNNRIQFTVAQAINTKTKEIWFEFMDTNIDYGDYYLKERNAYVLTVTDSTVFHGGISVDSDIELIKEEIIDLLKSKTSSDRLPQREQRDIKYFGIVETSKLGIVIDTDISPLSQEVGINWELYFETLQFVISIYEGLWDELSMETWQTSFVDLPFKKKLAVMECYRFSVELNFKPRKF